jgi:tight adherence protein C
VRRALGALESKQAGIELPRRVFGTLVDWLSARAPAVMKTGTVRASKLLQAGFDGPSAPVTFGLLRALLAIAIPLFALTIAPQDDPLLFVAFVGLSLAVGLLAAPAALDRLVAVRQDRIRRGIADALDLLIVCVEAGIALDSAMQRVARELDIAHPELATELLNMNRRIAAGMPREQAMQTLYLRTGIDELRGLTSHLVQSERWGTSVTTVLRVYSSDLRRRQKNNAERRAATASTRMLLPMVLFIFPTIFIVLLGPAALQLSSAFGGP